MSLLHILKQENRDYGSRWKYFRILWMPYPDNYIHIQKAKFISLIYVYSSSDEHLYFLVKFEERCCRITSNVCQSSYTADFWANHRRTIHVKCNVDRKDSRYSVFDGIRLASLLLSFIYICGKRIYSVVLHFSEKYTKIIDFSSWQPQIPKQL